MGPSFFTVTRKLIVSPAVKVCTPCVEDALNPLTENVE
jgi:hypothetical protein